MYRIGMFSKLGKVTVKTLRYYDEVGLLKPVEVNEDNGYRYYDTHQLFQLHEILALRQMGFSINEINEIFTGRNISGILEQRKAELISERDRALEQLFHLEHYINQRKEGIIMDYQVLVKEIKDCIVFSKRQVIPDHQALMQVVPAIGKAVMEANPGLTCAKPEYCFNVYHDGEYKLDNIDVEVCEAVNDVGKETDGIIFKKMPGITAATVMHKGAYNKMAGAYAYCLNWIENNGYAVSDLSRECFIDGIWNQENEDDWLTEIQIPIVKK